MNEFTFTVPMSKLTQIFRQIDLKGDSLLDYEYICRIEEEVMAVTPSWASIANNARKLMNYWLTNNGIELSDIKEVVFCFMKTLKDSTFEITMTYPTKEEAVMARLTMNV